MKIESLSIKNFRNIKELFFKPCDGVNIIYGDNAQGKTNLMEAVWIFTGAKSFRGAKESEYIGFGDNILLAKLSFFAQNRIQTASINIGTEKKTAFLNEIKQDSIPALAGIFCAVVFSPDHLQLIKRGPENRRKMIDVSLYQAYPKYGKVLEGYYKALKQRNTLLKDIPRHPSLFDTLDDWDKSIVDYGAYITAMRAAYIRKLEILAKEFYAGISGEKESISVEYVPGFDADINGFTKQDFNKALQKAVKDSRTEDIRLGVTGAGPHRDDLEINIGGKSAKGFASQGQQRSAILALKLAECGILEERNGEPPVIILDDVMSELDEHRRAYLIEKIKGRQALITCCDINNFNGIKNAEVFHVEHGCIINK